MSTAKRAAPRHPSGTGRRPRLNDVAAAVGLSPASVSLVLRNAPGPSAATRKRVLAAATRLGYRADRTASLLARRRRHLLGVLMDVRSPFHAELVEEVQAVAERLGYDVVLGPLTRTRDEHRAIETLVDFRCEALLLLGPESGAGQLVALDEQLPVVVVGRRIRGCRLDVVRTDDGAGVRDALDHLVELGHRAIAHVDGGRGTIAADRRRGYRAGVHRHGIVAQARVLPGAHTEESGARAAATILDGDSMPSAVVAFNDRCALGILDKLTRAGLAIPDELSLVGYDDSPAAQLAYVNLTTVRQDARQQAEHAVTAAVERLDAGRRRHREIVLPPQLVVRGTTAPPPGRTSLRRPSAATRPDRAARL